MCVNCLCHTEKLVAELAFVAAVVHEPAHRLLADLGLVNEPLAVARDARTVSFLRSLDLDPAGVLGVEMVAAADRWVAAGQPRSTARARAWARPMGSQRAIAAT